MDDRDRREWIDNDEQLYNWWRHSGMPIQQFVREHRDEISAYINRELNKPPVS